MRARTVGVIAQDHVVKMTLWGGNPQNITKANKYPTTTNSSTRLLLPWTFLMLFLANTKSKVNTRWGVGVGLGERQAGREKWEGEAKGQGKFYSSAFRLSGEHFLDSPDSLEESGHIPGATQGPWEAL